MPETNEAKGVIANLTMAGRAREAMDLWAKAFGAEEIAAYEDNGRIRHAELRINGGRFYLTDFSQEPMDTFQPSSSIALHLEVPDGEAWMRRAKSGGCDIQTPWHQQFGAASDGSSIRLASFGTSPVRSQIDLSFDDQLRRGDRRTGLTTLPAGQEFAGRRRGWRAPAAVSYLDAPRADTRITPESRPSQASDQIVPE